MYDFKNIDAKWQQKWDKNETFRALQPSETDKDPYYCLIEFPFPSGAGLHVGHPRSFTALDVIARKRRMQGYNVLYPIGWDAFGLPTENFAIKTGRPPQEVTEENIATFKRQLKSLGLSFDWSREVSTADPAYYKWTQWMFLEFFKAGLAYKSSMTINWCPSCKIGLANEEVVQGNCERCGNPSEKRDKEQWMIRITDYADRLLEDLDDVDYLEKIKKQQIDWIGRSEGAQLRFKIENDDAEVEVYTTRPDTIYGATYLVLAPEHELISHITSDEKRTEVEAYAKAAGSKSDIERQEGADKEKTGVFTGAHAIHPITGEKLPIWISDYVLATYGTGAIMAVPAHDARDFAFAKTFDLPIIPVVARRADRFSTNKADSWRSSKAIIRDGDKILVEKFKDHDFWALPGGRVEEGETQYDALVREVAEETGYQVTVTTPVGVVQDYLAYDGLDLKYRSMEFHVYEVEVANEMVEQREIDKTRSEWHWMSFQEAAEKITTSSPLTAELLRSYVKGEVFMENGVSVNSDEHTGLTTEEMKSAIIALAEEKGFGEKKVNYRLRDWVFSRQRYWGEPIPLVKCHDGCSPDTENWVSLADSDLPLELPKVEKYEPTDSGESPLAAVTEWTETTCPNCGGKATRETDTMPNWAGSSWYFLRYTDASNNEAFASKEALNYWTPVTWYNGGMEHTTLHLLYSRFWHKFLHDRGYVPTKEPYAKRTSHGLVLAEDGSKMSKSKGNVVNPDEIVQAFGADTLRMYELFMGPFSEPVPWSENGVVGVKRFLDKVGRFVDDWKECYENDIRDGGDEARELYALDHLSDKHGREIEVTLHKVQSAIEDMRFNSAVADIMKLFNHLGTSNDLSLSRGLYDERHRDLGDGVIVFEQVSTSVTIAELKKILLMINPFAPHLAHALWLRAFDEEVMLDYQDWPEVDESMLVSDTMTIAIQVNGKLRGDIEVAADASKDEILALAKGEENTKKYLTDGIKKEIYVPGKLVNFVV
jgi:leucyl-tRNA synthetase